SGPHPYSVAEHSLLVERLLALARPAVTRQERLAALLHDAPEYVIGDMISPFKAALGIDYKAFERRLARAVHLRFGLPADLPEAWEARIKRADRASAWFEATQLAGFSEAEAAKFFPRPRATWAAGVQLAPEPADAVRDAFIARFAVLSGD
ncbi:MAG: hydrolase, partial [Pseudomonadota bacterium]